jgi:hypothetical protein
MNSVERGKARSMLCARGATIVAEKLSMLLKHIRSAGGHEMDIEHDTLILKLPGMHPLYAI